MGSSENYYDADDLPAYEDVEEEVSLKDIERSDGVMDLLLSGNTAFIAYAPPALFPWTYPIPIILKNFRSYAWTGR